MKNRKVLQSKRQLLFFQLNFISYLVWLFLGLRLTLPPHQYMLFKKDRMLSVKYIWEHSFHPPAMIHLLLSCKGSWEKKIINFSQHPTHNLQMCICFASYNANHKLYFLFPLSFLPAPHTLSFFPLHLLSWFSSYLLVLKAEHTWLVLLSGLSWPMNQEVAGSVPSGLGPRLVGDMQKAAYWWCFFHVSISLSLSLILTLKINYKKNKKQKQNLK